MKLKKLTLQGYKTFASKTDFLFDDGITAVVGPNGSGKSNIADAIRWVLGEQSYSALRGKRTEDMIFAGSQTRARAGMAQAILTLDNSDGWLPIDFAEVEIGRRAYRSGENEYILNGQRVRLKDITELLATSGLSERTYTIIGQGLVDRALSLRADERRALFEEAAGIMHYKARRAETLRRLQETEHNLERVHDILSEIRPRLASLKRQATRARNYELVEQELRDLLRLWYGYKWDQARAELRVARQTAAESEKGWQESRQALLDQQQALDELQREINLSQQTITELQERREQLREQWERARREAAVLLERREATRRRLGEIDQELPGLETAQQKAQEELLAATADLKAAQAELGEAESRLLFFNQSFAEQHAEIERWQLALSRADESREKARRELAQAEGQLSQLKERLREHEEDEGIEDRGHLQRLEAEISRQTEIVESAQTSIRELRRQRDELTGKRQALIQQLKQQRREERDLETELSRQYDRVARLETRVELLDQMRQKEVDISENVALVGTLAGLITIPDTYRRAIEAAVAARLATLVVNDTSSLWALVETLDGRAASVVALDGLRLPQRPAGLGGTAVIGWADELVSFEAPVQTAVQLLLGNVLLVKDRRDAYELASRLPEGYLAASADGFVAHASGLVDVPGQSPAESILNRESAWREARETLVATADRASNIAGELAALQETVQRNQDQVDEWQNEERQLSKQETDIIQRLSTAQRQVDRAHQQQAFLENQRKRQAQELARLQERIALLEAQITGGSERIEQHELVRVEAVAKLEALPVAESQQQQVAIEQAVASARTIVAGRQAVVDSRRTTLNQLQGQLDRQRERRQDLLEQVEALNKEESTAVHESLYERIAAIEDELKPAQQNLIAHRSGFLNRQKETARLQRAAHEQETRYTQTQVRLSQQENQIESLQERIHADLGLVALRYDEDHGGPTPLPISEIVEELPRVAELPSDIEKNIHEYRGQLQRMGGINPDAPQEYEETEQRYEFLTQQVEDLHETEKQLRKVIGELDELTSRAFAETVDKVNEVFGKTFTQLFGGGSARLVLTEPDDLTISGVDIIARLPNQREQGLALLSGGERSLTASALIFSLLRVSPTPFCVMDEVDAALDEANINRFRDILRDLSSDTQFIVITHNRGTVQVAQTIYGVSMQPDSASQVISIRPEEYARKELIS